MSKSSGNNDVNLVFIEHLLKAIEDLTVRIEELSKSLFESDFFKNRFDINTEKYNASKKTSDDLERYIKNVFKEFENGLKAQFGIDGTKRLHAAQDTFAKEFAQRHAGQGIDGQFKEQVFSGIKQFFNSAVFEAIKGEQRGDKRSNLYFTNTLDNEKLVNVYKDFANKLGMKIDSVQYKLMNFFKETNQKLTRTIKELGEDIVEGLEKSKWVGGVMRDTFRLIGLLGANWLSKFGQLGRILGGAFYVAMETAGPLLVKLLLQGMGKLFMNFPKVLGNIIGGVGRGATGLVSRAIYNGGGPLSDMMTAPKGARLAAARGLIGPGLAAGAAFLGGGWALGQATDSWKQGRKGNAAALGIGGGALIAGGIAALVAGFTAPITVPLLAIGATVTAIAGVWKHFGGSITDHFKRNKEFYGKILDFISFVNPIFGLLRMFANWYMDTFGGWDIGTLTNDVTDSLGNKNNLTQRVANLFGMQDKEAVRTIKGMGINKAGYATNLSKLTPMQASDALKSYLELYGEEANNAYDWLKPGEFYPHLYKNDASIRNAQGVATLVPTYKGARQDLSEMNTALSQVGLSGMALSGSMRTAGRDGVTHVEGSLHDNIMGLVNDYAANWTDDASWFKAFSVLRPLMEKKGFDLWYEGYDAKGKRHMTNRIEDLQKPEFHGLTGQHFHVQRLPGRENAARTTDAVKNIEESKVRAQQQTIAITDIAKQLEPDIYNDMVNANKGLSEDDPKRALNLRSLESEMRNAGYTFDDETKEWIKKSRWWNKKEGKVMSDPSGNYRLEKIATTMEGMVAGSTDWRIS